MRNSIWRLIAVFAVGTFVFVIIAYFFNLWLFNYSPRLHSHLSPNEALFLEGLFVLALGFVVLLGLPYLSGRDPMREVIIPKYSESHKNVHLSGEVRALGLALITTSITMFLMHLFNIY